ncbi:MAG: magnesium transporter CorA family protein [Deltaproteobacteria bacterium]|nr:magnesium transporter CorA family protein [Deltaproteobacteria bacterium]
MRKAFGIQGGRLVPSESGGAVEVYINPDEAERRYLVEELKLDEHTLSSALDPDEVSRLEFEPEHVAIIFKRPKHYKAEDEFLFKVASTGVFLFEERVIIVLSEDVPLFEGRQFSRISSLKDVVLRMIYRSIFHFLEHLRVITIITDSLEDKISEAMENRYLLNLFVLQKSLVYFLNAINSNGVLVERLRTNARKMNMSQEQTEFLDDIIIENNQCYRQAEIYSNILAGLMDARVSIVSNNLNVLMKTLNIITIGIMVPTLVVSAFSMNVHIPLEDHPLAFWIVMSFAAVSVGVFLALWRHKRW